MNIKNLHIPLSQLLEFDLNTTEILLYGVILHHAYKSDCMTTNATLSKEINVSTRTITNTIKSLSDKKVIQVINEIRGNYQVRRIKPLVLFDFTIVPENYQEDKYAGMDVL